MAISNEKFFVEGTPNRLGAHHTDDAKRKLSEATKRQFQDPIARENHRKSLVLHTGLVWINNGSINKKVTPEAFAETYSGWNKGRLLGDVKFYEHSNRKRDITTGKFIR